MCVLAVPFSFFGFDNPLPSGMDQKIAAVALFGNGAAWAGPITNFSPLYSDRTIELCHGADPICNPADPNTWEENWVDHAARAYIDAGMVNQAADFVAQPGSNRFDAGRASRRCAPRVGRRRDSRRRRA